MYTQRPNMMLSAAPSRDDGSPASGDAAQTRGARAPTAGFVGRHKELQALRRALADVLRGRGLGLLISGEPGIGKTRLADELTDAATEQGFLALWGRCWEGGGAPAFWPWTQMLRIYIRNAAPDRLAEHLGARRADLVEIISSLTAGASELPSNLQSPDPAQARFRLFDAVTALLRSVADAQPLLLVLDDLHAADTDSLALLRFFSRELRHMRVLVVGTYREAEAQRSAGIGEQLAAISREAAMISLHGLNEAEVETFVRHVLEPTLPAGERVPATFVAAVHEVTNGNPFLVGEILRLVAAEGRVGAPADAHRWASKIPERLRELARHRLHLPSASVPQSLAVPTVIEPTVNMRDEVPHETPGNDAERQTAVAPSAAAASHRFRKEGEYWTITYDDATVRLKHTHGFVYIARLLRYPGREFLATDLFHNVDDVRRRRAAEPAAARTAQWTLGTRHAGAWRRRPAARCASQGSIQAPPG